MLKGVLPKNWSILDAIAQTDTQKSGMVQLLLITIANMTTKSKATTEAAKFTLTERHMKNNQITEINLKHVLSGELYEIALNCLLYNQAQGNIYNSSNSWWVQH